VGYNGDLMGFDGDFMGLMGLIVIFYGFLWDLHGDFM